MNTQNELHNALWGALTFQYHRGDVFFSEHSPHCGFTPLPLLCTSAEKLWESVLAGGVGREAARHHFVACTYAAVRSLNCLEPIAGDPERVLPGVMDHLLDWYATHGVGGLQLTRQVGCVVGVLTQSQRLQGIRPGWDDERNAWLNVLVGSVSAEMLYVQGHSEGRAVGHTEESSTVPSTYLHHSASAQA